MIKLLKLVKNTKRVGRGPSSGKGKTSGRGMNGQRSRTGSSTAFKNGGQTKFYIRLPKAKGFKRADKNYTSINAARLNNAFKDGETVTIEELTTRLKLEDVKRTVKIFGLNNLKVKLSFDEKIILPKDKSKK